jgi:hypothetical protein
MILNLIKVDLLFVAPAARIDRCHAAADFQSSTKKAGVPF